MSTEPVGSLTQEAAKLLAVLQGWASEHPAPASAGAGTSDEGGEAKAAAGGGPDEGPAGASASTYPKENGHEAHDPLSPECRWCPLCQLMRAAKATSPEVREHLTSAATSFALALQGLLEPPSQRAERAARESPLQKIDLAED